MSDETFRLLPDLASRALGGSVVSANDESFAEKENLIRPEPSVFDTHSYGHKGKVYDGWETRRRREPGHDWAVVRLGAPGIVRGVVVDTAHFTGNYPPEVSVEAAFVDGYPSPAEVEAAEWTSLVSRSPVSGDSENAFSVVSDRRRSHVRLSIYPDGGVARFRVHGEVVPDARIFEALGTVDLAAAENGGRVVGCSDLFYGSPSRLILPGLPRNMGEGWETRRRRGEGNDWILVRLATEGALRMAELDTSYNLHNAPGWASLSLTSAPDGEVPALDSAQWDFVLERVRLQPDTRHRFVLPDSRPATHARLDIFPDGAMARLRLRGTPTAAALERLREAPGGDEREDER